MPIWCGWIRWISNSLPLRRRSPKLLQEVYSLPRSAWRRIELDVDLPAQVLVDNKEVRMEFHRRGHLPIAGLWIMQPDRADSLMGGAALEIDNLHRYLNEPRLAAQITR